MVLIRPLVFAEANVPIDPHHDLLRRPDMHRRKLRHRLIHLADQLQHRLLQLSFKQTPASLKPNPIVIPLQPPQKLQCIVRKVSSHTAIVNPTSSATEDRVPHPSRFYREGWECKLHPASFCFWS